MVDSIAMRYAETTAIEQMRERSNACRLIHAHAGAEGRTPNAYAICAFLICALLALSGCAGATQSNVTATLASTLEATDTPQPTSTATSTISSGGGASGISAVEVSADEATPIGESVAQELLELSGIATLAGIAPTRTPLPIPTPDKVLETVDQALTEAGLQGGRFLWLDYADWISLLFSLLMVLIAYVVGVLLVNKYTQRLASKAGGRNAERLFVALGGHVRWLLVIWAASLATRRLAFLSSSLRTTLEDIFFFAALIVLVSAAWRLIGLAVRRGGAIASRQGEPERINSFVTLIAWFLYALVIVTAITFTFSHFAINVTGLALFIGIAGLGLSLAGRDLLSDLIAGMTILVDQPFRIGDRVDLVDLNTVGIVHEVGMRSTRIITANNRMVVVPNALMAKNQVINYSYPDPALNDGSEIRVAYENDAALVTRALTEAIRSVEGVQVDKPVGVFLTSFAETHMLFRMSWWVHSAADAFSIRDLVNRAALEKLHSEGIRLPYQRQRVLDEQPEPAPHPPPPPERPFPTTPVLPEGGDAEESLL